MVSLTAAIALAQNGFTTADLTAVNTEYVIDNAIDFVELEAGVTIGDMTGVAGSKTVTLTGPQNAVLSLLVSLMLREVKKTTLTNSSSTASSSSTAKAVSIGGLSVSDSAILSSAISAATSLNNASDFTREMFKQGIKRLIGSSFKRT